MDEYTVCLLGWYYGEEPQDVLKHESDYTQEQIDKAQAYCIERKADPISYWYGEEQN